MRDRLEQLLVGPVGLAGLLELVERRRPGLVEQTPNERKKRRLALVGGLEPAGSRDLVDA